MNGAVGKEQVHPLSRQGSDITVYTDVNDEETAMALANSFFFLALLFRYPDETTYAEIVKHMVAFDDFFAEYSGKRPLVPSVTELQAEYVSLFVNNKGFVPAIPYISSYLGNGQLMGEAYFKLKEMMAETGFSLNRSVNELEDHVSVLLEFCKMLIDTLIYNKQNRIDSGNMNISALVETTNRYIGKFVHLFCDNIQSNASHEFYKVCATALENFIVDADRIYAQLFGFQKVNYASQG